MHMFAQVVMLTGSGLARDDVVNGFAFQSTSSDPAADAASIVTQLIDFYNANDASGNHVTQLLSPWVNRGTNQGLIKVFNITGHEDGSPHGSPVLVQPWTVGAQVGGQHSMPEQVSVALSFRAPFGTATEFGPPIPPSVHPSRPRSSHRGRIYLGPFHNGILGAEDSTSRSQIDNGFHNALTAAANRLKTAGGGATPFWSVWSRKDAALRAVESVDVEGRFDTQRRRATRQGLLVFP